jgi:hypothetical protein
MWCAHGNWDVTGDVAVALVLLGSKLRNTPLFKPLSSISASLGPQSPLFLFADMLMQVLK